MGFWPYFTQNLPRLLGLVGEHVQLALFGTLLSAAVGIPLGALINRYRRLAPPVIWFTNTVQTIPALAFIGFAAILFGLGRGVGIFVLFCYGLMPIVRSTYTGLSQIDRGALEAARGMGMTRWQILRMVQFPLAMPVILVGLRVATVVAIGTASIMSLGGAGGLGREIFAGIARVQDRMIWSGTLLAMALALVFDFGFAWLERLMAPERRTRVRTQAVANQNQEVSL